MGNEIYSKQITANIYLFDPFQHILLSRVTEFLVASSLRHMAFCGFDHDDLVKNYNRCMVVVGVREKLIKDFAPQDTLLLVTWPVKGNSPLMTRQFVLKDIKGDTVFEASMLSALMDIKERKMITKDLLGLNQIGPDDPPYISLNDAKTEKIFRPEGRVPDFSNNIKVSFTDLDVNNHLNTARYFSFIENTLGYDWFSENQIREIEIRLQKEAKYGQEITVEGFNLDNEVVLIGGENFAARIKSKK